MAVRLLRGSATLVLVLACAGAVDAATSTANLSVNANVSSSCTLAAGAVNFGNLTTAITTTPVNATGTITVNCTPGGALSISLSGGGNLSGSQRQLANGGARLNYNVTQPNAAGTAISSPPVAWGDGTALGSVYATTGTGSAQVLNVYGTLPAQAATLSAGSYSDNIVVTLTY